MTTRILQYQVIADTPPPVAPITLPFTASPIAIAAVVGAALMAGAGFVNVPAPTAATPSALTFSQSPDPPFGVEATRRVTAAIAKFSDLIRTPFPGTVTPGPLGFSQWPTPFRPGRFPGLDTYSFVSSFIIAATPAPFQFSQSPIALLAPTAASLLASGTPGFVFVAPGAVTPSPLGFSQWPTPFLPGRFPGLDTYSFVSAFRTAITPTQFGAFSQPPIALLAPLAGPLRIAGSSNTILIVAAAFPPIQGWRSVPPAVFRERLNAALIPATSTWPPHPPFPFLVNRMMKNELRRVRMLRNRTGRQAP